MVNNKLIENEERNLESITTDYIPSDTESYFSDGVKNK